jgi:hypothetical protein
MKLADKNYRKVLVPRTGIRNCSGPGLRYQKNDRDPGFRDPGIAIYTPKYGIYIRRLKN